jgi:vancomycin resistance protein YoaR
MEVKTKPKTKSIIVKAVICLAGVTAAFFLIRYLSAPSFAEGTYYGSADVSGLTVAEAIPIAESEIKKILSETVISVKFAKSSEDTEAETVTVAGKDLEYTSELENFLKSAVKSKDAQKLTPKFDVSADKIESILTPAAERFKSEPKNAQITGFDFASSQLSLDNAVNGYTADVGKTAKAVAEAMEKGSNTEIIVESVITEPEVTDEDITSKYVLLASYSTISTNTANGNHNMQLALSKINATVLQPGEVFSYNEKLGDSTTAESGFLPAHAIVGGVLVDSYGGGICQPSSTLYNAALCAGMEIVERHCHMMPSSYVPIGLDATVSYGSVDFKFKNVLENPVYIFGNMSGTTVATAILGVLPNEWDEIKLTSWCDATIPKPGKPIYVVDKSLAKNDVVIVNAGYNGYRASALRKYYKEGAEVKTESLPPSNYSAKAATYKVGPGTDISRIVDGKYVEPTPEPSPSPSPDPTSEPSESQSPEN